MEEKEKKQTSKTDHAARKIIFAAMGAIVLLLVFQGGIWVGYRKAGFSYRNGDNYYRVFDSGRRGPFDMVFMNFSDTHGAIGKIIKISLPDITVEDRSGVEKTVAVESETVIKRGLETVQPADLKTGDSVLIIGEPNNDAVIEARLVRIIPPPPVNQASTTSETRPVHK